MARISISVAAENVRQSLTAHSLAEPARACCSQTVERQPGPGCNQTAQDIPNNPRPQWHASHIHLTFAKQRCPRCGRLRGLKQENQLGPVASPVRDTMSRVLFLLMPVATVRGNVLEPGGVYPHAMPISSWPWQAAVRDDPA